MDSKLREYIGIISNNTVNPQDDYVAPLDDNLIYKFICYFSTPDKTSLSHKFTKKLINKLRLTNSIVRMKTDKNVYEVTQKMHDNHLLVLEYNKGPLKDRFLDQE